MAPRNRIRLGDLLVEHKYISEGQLSSALNEQKRTGRKLGRVLVEHGYIKEDQILKLLSTQLKLPYIDLAEFTFSPDIVKIVPETVARRYRVIALHHEQDGLLIGMADPTNIFAFDELVRLLKQPIVLAVVRESDLLLAIDQQYQRDGEIQSLAAEVDEDIAENVFDINTLNQGPTQSDAPVVKLIETIFEDAIKMRASDIHIEPDEKVLRIRRRIDGVLFEQVMDEKRIAVALISKLKLMAGMDISEKRLPQDGRFDLKVKDNAVDVRVATMPTTTGEAIVMRLLDRSNNILSLDNLGLHADLLQIIKRQVQRPHGLLLVTGPTGSGKTTTLYSMLNELNSPQKKIITAEDPVEYQLPRINQVQIAAKIGLNFPTVLRSTLRQDPDVMFIGEIRDKETADICLRAAMTGHLVLSSLHTNDSISTAMRLIDMGAESFLVAASINVIIAQRLIRKVCENCRQDYILSQIDKAWLDNTAMSEHISHRYVEGVGCSRCNNTGFQGRMAIHEILEFNDPLRNFVRRGEFEEFKQAAIQQKSFTSLQVAGINAAISGHTSLSEAIRIGGWL
ncbi:MAG: GspE/PulE family protein [Thiohalomonadales bacterium]